MSDVVVDSSVMAKWVLPEPDSARAHQLVSETIFRGERLIVLDLAFAEVTNAIWKRHRQGLATLDETRQFLDSLIRSPVTVEPARDRLTAALELAIKYDRAVYDALFLALVLELGMPGVTADGPLHRVVQADFPQVVLFDAWQ